MSCLKELLKSDPYRMSVLRLVASLDLPDCYVAAGFVRNMVWDHLHQLAPSKLNDIDVVFFDSADTFNSRCKYAETLLHQRASHINWQVKNQAMMHLRNNDNPYNNTSDAMSFWPEKETAVGVHLKEKGLLGIAAPFGIESLFRGEITFNPKRDRDIFLNRIESKQWLKKWPNLKIVL